MYRCFQEAGDVVMCKSIEETIELDKKYIDLNYTKLSPSDLECLTNFFTCSSCKEWKKSLDLRGCHIQDHGLEILQHGLRNSNVTITDLWLSDNNFSVASSSAIRDLAISCRVKELRIGYNNTVGEDSGLYNMMSSQSSMIEVVYMGYTKLSSQAAIKLFSELSEAEKLKVLWISFNDVGDEACNAIIMAMKKNASLVELNIYSNPIVHK